MICIVEYHSRIGTAHGEDGFLHVSVDAHTNGIGHSLVTGTIGVQEAEKRLRAALRLACDDIARDIEQAVEAGALIE